MLLRLVLTYPIILIVMIGICLIITLILIVLGMISPALMSIGVLLSIVPSAAGVLLPMLVVVRLTLQSRGVTPSGTYGGLFWGSGRLWPAGIPVLPGGLRAVAGWHAGGHSVDGRHDDGACR